MKKILFVLFMAGMLFPFTGCMYSSASEIRLDVTTCSVTTTGADVLTYSVPESGLDAASYSATKLKITAIIRSVNASPVENRKDYKDMSEEEIRAQFYVTEIDDALFARIRGKSYKEDCTVPVEDLRYIHLLHKDLEGNIHEGEMICNAAIAEDLCEIFEELYDAGYPIEKVRLIDEYDADDEKSMEDNNSSCFNFRLISHTTKVSKHGLGLAVDINPLYNPYIKTVDGELIIEPVNAGEYIDRSKDFNYKIDENDMAYKLFTEHGFEWGGSWESRKDYQHFELPDDVVEKLYPNT